MASNIDQFNNLLKETLDSLENKVADVVKESVLTGYENLLRPKSQNGAPKQTGWMRSLFLISTDTPDERIIGSKKNVDTSVRDSLAEEYKNLPTKQVLSTDKHFISLNAPYTSDVNYGNSKQKGQKFVEKSIQDIEQALRQKSKIGKI